MATECVIIGISYCVKHPDKKTLIIQRTKEWIILLFLVILAFHFVALRIIFGSTNLKDIYIRTMAGSPGSQLFVVVITIYFGIIELLILAELVLGLRYIFDKREHIFLKNRRKITDFDSIRRVRIKRAGGGRRSTYNLLVDLQDGREIVICSDHNYRRLNHAAEITAKFVNASIRREIK